MSATRRLPLAAVLTAAIVLALAAAAGPDLAAAPGRGAPGVPPDIDALVGRVMKSFEVPGLALAIVKDGRVVLAKGYGVRKLGDPAPVDARTLFGIASNTKVFTATALGLLVEEGKIAWDAPVVDYLPWFMMYDPYVTRELTVRDLLVHRSGLGLGAGDLLWWPESTYTRRQVAERLRFIRPATSFRSAYAYDNVLYLVAGELIQAVTGQTWEDFVLERVLKRVGMTASNVRHSAAIEGGNVATPHARVGGAVRPIAPFTSDNTNPAGGINSGAEDMAKWMLVRLARGRLADGTRLYSDRTARELEKPVTILPNPAPPAELAPLKAHFRAYALGLDIRDYRGFLVVDHTGGLPGYVSIVTLLPERSLGVAVLTNAESTSAFYALTQEIVDDDLGAPAMDWPAAYLKRDARVAEGTAKAVDASAAARDAASRPSLPLAKYAGIYTDAWYGDVAVEEAGGRLVLRFTKTPALTGDLEHWQYDTFVVRWRDRELRADAFVTFALNPDGSIDRVKMAAVSPETDFSYDFQDLDLRPARKPSR
jgi:CubicO group peptidase (beta-lactamase class C family)